ncbi:MAG: ATP--guanido phosphotransferase [Clostridia bacterium]|nr:ATP--guanido phosphotransferase [Clostridia bacterium]
MNIFETTVVSTRIRLARNINGLPFPNRLRGEEQIYSVLYAGVKKACDRVFANDYYSMANIDSLTSQALVERHLISKNLQKSKYGAAFISKPEDISVMVNEEDHLRIQSIIRGFHLEDAYNNVAKVDAEIKKNLDVAFDPKLGYLTSCPTNLGSGMRASVMLFLPGLTMTNRIEALILKYQQLGITIRGIYGEGSKAEGDLYQVSNQAAISLSESEILNMVKKVVENIVNLEDVARKEIAQRRGLDLKNDIMISYGILKYACKMSSQELMQNLALVKLGVALGYININMEKLNNLTVNTQPAMMCFITKKNMSAEQRDIARVKMVQDTLRKEE